MTKTRDSEPKTPAYLRRVQSQRIVAAKRAKYGPLRHPAPIIVKSLQTGEVLAEADARKFVRQKRVRG